MARKRTRTRKVGSAQRFAHYILRIKAWEPSYSLAVGNLRDDGPYREHAILQVVGELVIPGALRSRCLTLTIFGDRRQQNDLEARPATDWKPNCVGSITVGREEASYLGFIPFDAMWAIQPPLAAGVILHIDLYGEALRRGRAQINSIEFCGGINIDEYE